MRILITAGGTSEKIDDVRSITNHSTGSLGKNIAEKWLKQDVVIDYVTTPTAVLPEKNDRLHVHFIEDTDELLETLTDLLKKHRYHSVIHSMAVSDFTPAASLSEEDLITQFNQLLPSYQNKVTPELLKELLEKPQQNSGKISSKTNHLFLALKKTPKVIQTIKKIQPKTKLVGFKLLVDVSQEELFQVASESLLKSQSDFVLANDLTQIEGNRHIGHLLNHNGVVGSGSTKQEIAALIVNTLLAE